MSEKQPKTYKSRHPVRTVITVAAAVLIAAVILFACVFFGFKKYIVYSEDGVRLDIPWLQKITNENDAEIAIDTE